MSNRDTKGTETNLGVRSQCPKEAPFGLRNPHGSSLLISAETSGGFCLLFHKAQALVLGRAWKASVSMSGLCEALKQGCVGVGTYWLVTANR